MKANDPTNAALASTHGGRSPRRVRRTAAAAVIGLLALSACTSDPGAKRVAQDIVKAESLANPNLDEECLLGKLDEFSADELDKIGDTLESGDTAAQADAQTQLDALGAALESCS